MERKSVSGFTAAMKSMVCTVAGWRIQLEILFQRRVAPSLAMVLTAGLMISAVVWAFQGGSRPELAARVMGLASFGGIMVLAALSAGMLMARGPREMVVELSQALDRCPGSRWRRAQLVKAQLWLASVIADRDSLLVRGRTLVGPQLRRFGYRALPRYNRGGARAPART